jgi:hypothetical protein
MTYIHEEEVESCSFNLFSIIAPKIKITAPIAAIIE